MATMKPISIAIVGGGPGGLMTSYLLQQRCKFAHKITIFEASDRLGGKIRTEQFSSAAVPYEAGAAELYDYSQLGPDPLRDLVRDLGLTAHPMAGDAVVMGGRVLKTLADIRREFGDEASSALQRFAQSARAHIRPAEYYESDWKTDSEDPLSKRSFASLLDEVPDENARRYIEIAVHSDLATEPERTSAAYGLQNYLMNMPEYMRLYTIEGGIERLTQGLARRLTAEVRLNRPVVSVERVANGDYRVGWRSGPEVGSSDFDFVVVALPSSWIPFIEWRGAALGSAMRRHFEHYSYPAHYLRVSALFDRPFWRPRIADSYFMTDSFGGCCVYDESFRYGNGSHGALGWLLGGEWALAMSNLDDATIVAKVVESLPRCLCDGNERVREGRVHRWLGAVSGLPGGRPLREPDSRHLPEGVDHPWLFVVGDYLFDSTLNGVLDSADTVAEWIAEEVTEYHVKQPAGMATERLSGYAYPERTSANAPVLSLRGAEEDGDDGNVGAASQVSEIPRRHSNA
jgi:protoporphyrinogen oxidase